MILSVPEPGLDGKSIPMPGIVPKPSATPGAVSRGAPLLSEHSDEVLGAVLDQTKLAALRAEEQRDWRVWPKRGARPRVRLPMVPAAPGHVTAARPELCAVRSVLWCTRDICRCSARSL